jgi:hypothetical protein
MNGLSNGQKKEMEDRDDTKNFTKFEKITYLQIKSLKEN